jgi:hypothetical protein
MSLQENGTQASYAAPGFRTRKYLNRTTLSMAGCCLLMALVTGLLIVSAPAGLTAGEALLLAAPLFGCVAIHAFVRRVMGKPCHTQVRNEADRV